MGAVVGASRKRSLEADRPRLRLEPQDVQKRGSNLGPARLRYRGDPRPQVGALDNPDPFRLGDANAGQAIGWRKSDLPREAARLRG